MNDRFILIGHPVSHSVSPAIHRAAYRLLDRCAEYELHDAEDEAAVGRAIEALRRGEITGANVTVPWKTQALALADRADETAARVGAANVLARGLDGEVVAYNSDALALTEELVLAARDVGDKRGPALVLGTGGAARAAVVSCQGAGYGPVFVSGRRFTPDRDESSWPEAAAWRELGARPLAWPLEGRGFRFDAETSPALVVQATSAGMKGMPGGLELAELIPWAELEAVVAYDLVYSPPVTPFLEHARRQGHRAEGGLGMLVGQAARAIEIWWGVRPSHEPLLTAARAALGL